MRGRRDRTILPSGKDAPHKRCTNNNRITVRDVDSWVDLRGARTRGDAVHRAVPVPAARSAGDLRVVARQFSARSAAIACRSASKSILNTRASSTCRRSACPSISFCCAPRAHRSQTNSGPKLFTELGERIHEAVLVHRDVILYANSQFASFVGVDRVDLIDRTLCGPGRAGIRRAGRREPAPPSRGRARRRTLRGGDGRPAGPGQPARTNYRADRFRGCARAARDRRGSHPDEEAARARQRQDRREGGRRASRDGRAAAATATAARTAAAGVRHAVARPRPSSPPTSKAASCS